MTRCDLLFSDEGPGPKDFDGCRLAVGHAGPHEFVSLSGVVYQWETDWSCTCDECMSEDPEFCAVYWRA